MSSTQMRPAGQLGKRRWGWVLAIVLAAAVSGVIVFVAVTLSSG